MKLKIDNSICVIEGYTQAQFKELRDLLSYSDDPKAKFYAGHRFSAKKFLITKRGEFPTGLLYLVQDWAKVKKLNIDVKDVRVKPAKVKKPFVLNLPHSPYPEQEKAAYICETKTRGIVCAPTGVGKSVIAALIIAKLQVRTLIVVPSLNLKEQLTSGLAEAFGAKTVGGLGYPIAVENVDALDPLERVKYDCVIIDEFHHSGAKTYRKLNTKAWAGVYYKLGLTATPFRSQDHERLLLESVLSEVIYRVDYQTAVSKGYIVPMEAYYYELPKQATEAHTWAQVYKELVVNNAERNALISDILINLKESGASTLCLVKEIEHGKAIEDLSQTPFANGMDGNSEPLIKNFNRGGQCLTGTTGVLGEGVDTKPAEFIIIAGLGKSKNAFMQQVGRGFRRYKNKSSCKIILFLDRSHKFTLRHFKEQVKILKEEYGVIPVKLEY